MHWTYDGTPDETYLHQGDVLQRTAALIDVLSEVHPYFAQAQYVRFMLLTQTCDLVRRGGAACKAPYLSIAAVRPFDEAIRRELAKIAASRPDEQLCGGEYLSAQAFQKLKQQVGQILNNNHPEYFYLHAEPTSDLAQPCCAFLRVTIPLKIEHYDTLLEAKELQLKSAFQAKLGWLVGNTYSRVGTPDWGEADESRAEMDEIVNASLDVVTRQVERKAIKFTKRKLKEENLSETIEQVDSVLVSREVRKMKPRPLIEAAMEKYWPEGEITPKTRARYIQKIIASSELGLALGEG